MDEIEKIANKYAYDRPQSVIQATEKRDSIIKDISNLFQYHKNELDKRNKILKQILEHGTYMGYKKDIENLIDK